MNKYKILNIPTVEENPLKVFNSLINAHKLEYEKNSEEYWEQFKKANAPKVVSSKEKSVIRSR